MTEEKFKIGDRVTWQDPEDWIWSKLFGPPSTRNKKMLKEWMELNGFGPFRVSHLEPSDLTRYQIIHLYPCPVVKEGGIQTPWPSFWFRKAEALTLDKFLEILRWEDQDSK